jgi:hypothetical protein
MPDSRACLHTCWHAVAVLTLLCLGAATAAEAKEGEKTGG